MGVTLNKMNVDKQKEKLLKVLRYSIPVTRIGQTKIIYYNLPDVTGNIDKKLNFIEYVPILIIPAYYK